MFGVIPVCGVTIDDIDSKVAYNNETLEEVRKKRGVTRNALAICINKIKTQIP